ncbi:MAG TPA: (2Fe-2S)-binding protein, partial [Clostridium sp.]
IDERNEIISLDKRYGNIICLCNQVTEGEIVDSIRRPLGARTLQGIKRRTGAALGNCHGSFCVRKMVNILAREMDKRPTEIVEDSKDSKIWIGRIKEFDEV